MPSKMNPQQWPAQPGKKMGHDLQADLQDFLKPTGGSFVITLTPETYMQLVIKNDNESELTWTLNFE